ncbi:tRNA (adenosine(37)-N6)-threonylcarbamoyltransferase complex ATPase subunit type 1 TsaE [Maricaulis sp. CAU 1757]
MRLPARLPLDDLTATRRFGTQLAGLLRPGDAVMLEGDLGAGKTTLARAVIAAACGVEDAPSPTYTLVQVYDTVGGDALWHADLYRIEDPEELDELGLEDAFEEAICLVEWPERLGEFRPGNRLEIILHSTPNGDEVSREARLRGFGGWEARIEDD